MRNLIFIVIALILGGVAWFAVRSLTPPSPPEPIDPFVLVHDGDLAGLQELQRADEVPIYTIRNEANETLLEMAFKNDRKDIAYYLLETGPTSPADVRFADGSTLLHLAAQYGEASDVWYAMNAAVDPMITRGSGEIALELARGNPAVRNNTVTARLAEFETVMWQPPWPSGYHVPIPGATISSRRSHLPGALRSYRNGRHEGFDFYSGTVSVAIEYGTPIVAVADGEIIRVDHDFVEVTESEYNAIIDEARSLGNTSDEGLDVLRGRQVWIEHAGGFVSRYAHLAAVTPSLQVGTRVGAGDEIGTTGNSGTIEAVWETQDDPHPHVEIWLGEQTFLGEGLSPEEIWGLAGQVFGLQALPPYTD